MTNRILDISEGGVHLRVENRQLVVEKKDAETRTIPLEDIGVVVLGSGWLSLTAPVLSELGSVGASVVVCDHRSLPLSLCVPVYGHSLQAQKLAAQMAVSAPVRKRLWQQVVIRKITNQAAALHRLHGTDSGLAALARRVRSGDPDNVEAQAARKYWPLLFRNPGFRRQPGADLPPNHLLDYGYGVLRAICARALCASGLNVTLGLHHHERDNSYCLADDMMEPLRPLVDVAVAEWLRSGAPGEKLDRPAKQAILLPLLGRLRHEGEERTLFDVMAGLAAALARSYGGDEEDLSLPHLFDAR